MHRVIVVFVTHALFADGLSSPVDAGYVKVFDGQECDGGEIRMYAGDDNPGKTAKEIVHACFEACRTKKTPEDETKSWASFGVAKGFTVIATGNLAGRCYCESADSSTCSTSTGKYDRYDFKSPGLCDVGLVQRGVVWLSLTSHILCLHCVLCWY